MIRSIEDIINNVGKTDKIIVLYSGGLDGTFLLAKLKEMGYENLFALHVDIGGTYNLSQIEQRVKLLKVEYDILSISEEFINEYILSAIFSQAKYLGGHPLSASLSRPLIAKSATKYVLDNNIHPAVVLHTSNSSQNSLRRFNQSLKDLGYQNNFGSPFEKSYISRSDKLNYLNNNGILLDLKLFSEDSNIWCREFEYGNYDNIENIQIPEESYMWTKKDSNAIEETISIEFKNGVPIALNEILLSLKEIILSIRDIAGKYGIGRYIGLEEIQTGEKVLEVRETPGATILLAAYKDLELATVSSETARIKAGIEQIWVREASEGRWFSQLRKACDEFSKEIAQNINGSVSYRLIPDSFQLVSLRSNNPNYIVDRDIFESCNL